MWEKLAPQSSCPTEPPGPFIFFHSKFCGTWSSKDKRWAKCPGTSFLLPMAQAGDLLSRLMSIFRGQPQLRHVT